MKVHWIFYLLVAILTGPIGFAIDFEQDVEPILMANCVGCHAKMNPAAGLQFLSVETILKGSAHHKVVEPGKPDESLMVKLITGEALPKMPPKPLLPLEKEDIAVIREWIASLGASEKVVDEPKPEPVAAPDVNAHENPAPEALDDEFARRIHPILQSNCLGCHGAEHPKAGLDLTALASITKGSRKGKVIEPGKPEDSVLFKRVAQLDGAKPMPPKPMMPLSEEDIKAIHHWIASMGPSAPKVEAQKTIEPDKLLENAGLTYEHDEIGAVAFHPSEPLLAVGKLHRVELYRYDAGTKKLNLLYALKGHSSLVRALRFSPDGQSLAAAGGRPALEGEVIVWNLQSYQPVLKLKGHDDCIYDIEYSPDGAALATCSYDRSIKLWDAKSGDATKTLLDHVDAVYAIAFSPDGSRIASAAGDRTVKVWDAQSGKRLYTLSEPVNAQYAAAFHPDGVHLAAAGADKIIRVWELGETSGKLVESKFSHDGAVLDLFYSRDGATLFSTAEDRLVKAWRSSDFQEQQVWGPQPDWVFSLASDANGSLLAMGCYDGTLRLYDIQSGQLLATIDETPREIQTEFSTETVAEANPESPQKVEDGDPFRVRVVKGNGTYLSALSYLETRTFVRGATYTVNLHGKNLDEAQILPDDAGVSIRVTNVEAGDLPEFKRAEFTTAAEIVDTGRPYVLTLEMSVGENVSEGVHRLWAQTPLATTNMVAFAVEAATPVNENEENGSFAEAPWLVPPCIAAGAIGKVGDVDLFRLKAQAGEELLFDVMAGAIGSSLVPSLEIVDEQETVLASGGGRMGYRFERDGEYGVRIQDANLRQGGFYRLHVSRQPLVETVFPLGAQKGATTKFSFAGFNLGEKAFEADVPKTDEEIAKWNPFPFAKPNLALSDYPDVFEDGANNTCAEAMTIDAPCVVNGRIDAPDEGQDEDWYRFEARQGEPLTIAVEAQQYGSPLDSIIEVFDAEGNSIETAAVRCVAETFLTLSDRDSRTMGMRLDSWTDLTINDYMMVGQEILRVIKLPDYPDEDVLFVGNARFGWRYGLFGTTPSFHAVYTPAYKVEIHSPGTQFSPNGMPVFRLYARNDDGGAPTYRKDSYLVFDPPKDGVYCVRIADAMQQGGPEFAYRLHVRSPQLDYKIYVDNSRLNIHEGGRYPLRITADRIEGFDAPIEVSVRNLPGGFASTSSVILPGEESCSITIWAEDGAQTTAWNENFIVEGRSRFNGEEAVRESHINQLSVVRAADVTISQEPDVLSVRPGESVKCTVKIKRSNGFTGRVPIDVRNLPFGVYVMDTGLNGILVTENESERTFEIYAEPWVKPMEREFYSIASVETRSPVRHWNASNNSALKIEASIQQAALNLKPVGE